jgi:hypothetical protein
MPKYEVRASVQITCEIEVDAENENDAQKNALEYLDVVTNYKSEYFKIPHVVDIELDDVNEIES